MAHRSDQSIVERSRNLTRFFVENRQISWVLLIGTAIWGWYGYHHMPQRKDPNIPVRIAVAVTPWPGVPAVQVEQQVTRLVEERIRANSSVGAGTPDAYGIRSVSLPGLSIVYLQLSENVKDTKREFSDIGLKLNALNASLPRGAGPIQFQSDFGDTTTIMLTVASPRIDDVEIALRARSVRQAIERVRRSAPTSGANRVTAIYSFPQSISAEGVRQGFGRFVETAERDGIVRDARRLEASGFLGVDGESSLSDGEIRAYIDRYVRDHASGLHPDAWGPAIIRDPAGAEAQIKLVAGDKYSYRELDNYTDLIARSLVGAPQASKYQRSGVLPEEINLDYSQERLASYGLQPGRLASVLQARNIEPASGAIEAGDKFLYVNPTGEFTSPSSIGDVIVSATNAGAPIYLRDLVQISRGYQTPARFLNYYTWRDAQGEWHRSRAVTVAIFMRDGSQIAEFGNEMGRRLETLKQVLPRDLIIARTTDQPRQVEENIDLFMDALYEAIVLVVLVSLVGFWEWRSALLMALSIPVTLAMTFGFMSLLGLDLQQVSIASLIIALGLLVDNPVVAGDAIKRLTSDDHRLLIAVKLLVGLSGPIIWRLRQTGLHAAKQRTGLLLAIRGGTVVNGAYHRLERDGVAGQGRGHEHAGHRETGRTTWRHLKIADRPIENYA